MSEPTKTCNLTKYEIECLIKRHGFDLNSNPDETIIERINYLNKRLKAFDEPVTNIVSTGTAGWSNNNG